MRSEFGPDGWPLRPAGRDMVWLFALCGGLAMAAIMVARQPGSIATIWLANAVAVAYIVSSPRGRAPGLLATATLATGLANLAGGQGPGASLAFAFANGVEIAFAALLVWRSGRGARFASDHVSLLWLLAAGALLPPVLGATVAASLAGTLGYGPAAGVWSEWYAGSTLGAIAVLPFALSLRATPVAEWRSRLFSGWALASGPLVFAFTVLALHFLAYSFIAIAIALALLALALPRVCTFFNTLVMVCSFALALPLGWFEPSAPDTALGHFLVFLAVAMVVIPTQIAAVVVARQRSLSEMLAAVGSRANEIIVLTDMQGMFRWANPAREVYWNQPNEQMLGRHWRDNLPPTLYRDQMEALVDQATAGNTARSLVEIDFPLLGRRTMEIEMRPARDEEGRQTGVLSCATDVTELEASRRELQQLADELRVSNQNLEQFVRIASHDLREPLNTVAQFCSLIESDPSALASADARLYFAQVRGGALRMRTLLDDVLRFVRLEAGATEAKTLASLDDIVADVLSSLRSSIDTADARFDIEPLGKARCYPGLLMLVVQNLVSNAIKFVAPGRLPRVGISARREGAMLRLTVADNGIGIDAARVAELGTPFRRLHSRRKFEGTGLGLAICRRIAEQHGGCLEIESVSGEGSRFHLLLPDA